MFDLVAYSGLHSLRGPRGSKRSRLKAANAATIKKYLKPGAIRDFKLS